MSGSLSHQSPYHSATRIELVIECFFERKMYRNDVAVHPDSRFTYDDSRLSYYTTTPLYSYTRNNKLKTVNYSRLTQLRNSETSLLQTLHDISQLSVKVIDGIGVALVPVGKLVFVFHFDLVLQTW